MSSSSHIKASSSSERTLVSGKLYWRRAGDIFVGDGPMLFLGEEETRDDDGRRLYVYSFLSPRGKVIYFPLFSKQESYEVRFWSPVT